MIASNSLIHVPPPIACTPSSPCSWPALDEGDSGDVTAGVVGKTFEMSNVDSSSTTTMFGCFSGAAGGLR